MSNTLPCQHTFYLPANRYTFVVAERGVHLLVWKVLLHHRDHGVKNGQLLSAGLIPYVVRRKVARPIDPIKLKECQDNVANKVSTKETLWLQDKVIYTLMNKTRLSYIIAFVGQLLEQVLQSPAGNVAVVSSPEPSSSGAVS